jgi:anaerobic magnesium-protoporphyrin IX monomethyl ester cyclase
MSIASACRQKGYRVQILDALATGKSRPAPLPDELAYLAATYGPPDCAPFALFHQYRHFGYALATIAEQAHLSGARLIGISSLFSAYEDMALACAQVIKARCPQATIVLGGHHPTAFPERILEQPAVDIVLRGEGEESLPALADALLKGSPLAAIPGVAYKRDHGSPCIRPAVYAANLDHLPLPSLDLVKNRYYARKGRTTLVIAASRGCPMACTYCCMGAHSRIPYRRRTVAHVMREIEQAAKDHDIGLIDFEDENIVLDHTWFTDLLHHLVGFFGNRPPELRAMNGLFPQALDQETLALMKAAGFRELNLSLGTSDPLQARRFRRPLLTAAFDRALSWAAQLDMTTVGYLIAGAPGQSPLTSLHDLLFLASRRALVGLSVFYPAPDSLDFRHCEAAGLLPDTPLAWRSTALPIDDTTRRGESLTLLRLARMLNFMKQCVDLQDEHPFPEPSAYDGRRLEGTRLEMGRQLLRWFLADGVLRGVDPRGAVFVHPAPAWLPRSFCHSIQRVSLRGVKF